MTDIHEYSGDNPLTILKARIALLATAIGGPDYTSHLEPPPYKLGDDCLACLRDLKRWFKLVDDQQNRWDVAMACAEYCILIDDLLPILIDWENKCSLAAKLARKGQSQDFKSSAVRNKEYHDSIALNCLQLIVLMTWPLILTEQSPAHQVSLYTDLKKHQLSYKRHILTSENGKALKAANRLAFNILQIDKLERTPRDNMILRLVLNFFRNLLAIEPGELTISSKQHSSTRGINTTDMLPPGVSMDDISHNAVVSAFQRNKVLALLLTLASSSSSEFDQEFITIPLMEVMFYMVKEIDPKALIRNDPQKCGPDTSKEEHYSPVGLQLTELLEKERRLKKIVVQNTSTRHSRFGALLSIQTADHKRLTVSGGQNLLDDTSALRKLDNSKKWSKRVPIKQDEASNKGLPNSLLNSQGKSFHFRKETLKHFIKFIENFLESGFNPLLHRITNHFTTEQDQMVILEQIQYLFYYSWFLRYYREVYGKHNESDDAPVSMAVKETSFILVSSLLRKGYEEKNWAVAHAGMIAFNELLLLINNPTFKESEDVEFILSRLLSDNRLQLLANLPKSALKHSMPFIRSSIHLTHTALKTFEAYDDDANIMVSKKTKSRDNDNTSQADIENLMESEQIDRDEAIEILTSNIKDYSINFQKVQRYYMNEPMIDTYISFLQRYMELEDEDLKKGIHFLHRVLTLDTEQSLLFRIDLIVLLRDMLSSEGVPRTSPVRKHIEKLSDYYLHKIKKKLKSSSAWFVGILFPLLHDSEVGFFQKYGEAKIIKKNAFYAVPPSRFKRIEDEEQLPDLHVVAMHYGIVVSALLDEGKQDLVDQLVEHLKVILSNVQPTSTILRDEERLPRSAMELSLREDIEKDSLFFDKDFRAILKLVGYHLPLTVKESCYLPAEIEIAKLKESLNHITKYLTTPFETPNGLPSSSYLIRPKADRNIGQEEQDGWVSNEDYELNEPGIVNDDDEDALADDNGYFNELLGDTYNKSNESNLARGMAKTKKKSKDKKKKPKKRSRNTLPTFEVGDNHVKHDRALVSSKEIISDSEDEDVVNPVFFENEMYMRFLLDKFGGQLPDEKYSRFGKFAAERMANNGDINSDFTDLFGGPVPQISSLQQVDASSTGPGKTLISLSDRISAQIEADPDSQTDINDDEQSIKIRDTINGFGSPTGEENMSQKYTSAGELPVEDDSSVDLNDEQDAGDFVVKKRRKVFVEDDDE